MNMPGRDYSITGKRSRHSINGQERSDELNDNLTTAEFWEYDSRIGRRWNVDPVLKENESPFVAFGNNPITNIDPDGSDTIDVVKTKITDRLKGNSNSGNTGVASMASKTLTSTSVGISIKGAEGVDVFRYKSVEINYQDGKEVSRSETAFQELDIRGVANTAYRTRFSERATLAGLVPASLLDAYAEKNKNFDFPTYVGVSEAKALQSTIPFAQKLNKIQNTIYAISGAVQISKVVLTKLAQSGALFSINGGYGIQGKIGNYKYDLLYSNATGTPGGSLFSFKQMKNGGNMIRIDYGKFHNPSGELGWHSTFRYNILGKTYGSGAQYPVTAPFTFWLYPQKK
jgi:hypothetical protein